MPLQAGEICDNTDKQCLGMELYGGFADGSIFLRKPVQVGILSNSVTITCNPDVNRYWRRSSNSTRFTKLSTHIHSWFILKHKPWLWPTFYQNLGRSCLYLWFGWQPLTLPVSRSALNYLNIHKHARPSWFSRQKRFERCRTWTPKGSNMIRESFTTTAIFCWRFISFLDLSL